jgi:hypothetical protein
MNQFPIRGLGTVETHAYSCGVFGGNMSDANSMLKESKSAYELALAHYEFVNKEFTEYYGKYMRSWSIAGSAILVGAILGLGKVEEKMEKFSQEF